MRLLLKNADILCEVNEQFSHIQNGFLGIDGDTICFIGTEHPAGEWDVEKDMSGRMLLPGLINCHCHSAMVLMRGLGSDLPLQEWLFDKMMPIENKLDASDIAVGTNLALLEMLACGTTSFSDMYIHPEITAELVASAGMKANLCRVVQSFDEHESYHDNYRARESLDFFKNYHGTAENRILVDFAIHAEYTCTPHVVQEYSAACKAAGGRMHIHLAETQNERDACIAKYGVSPVRWFYNLGTFDSPTAAAHCVWLSEEDMQILKEKNVSVIHNPSSNMKLGSGFSPVAELLKRGVNVALGTDGAASNNNLNMLEEMHLAAILHNGYHRDPTILKAEEILAMATSHGALLQGRPDTGSLAVGKKADLIALDLTAPHMQPLLDATALSVYSAQGSDVVLTMVDGKILYENGEYYTLDKERILYEVGKCIHRLYIT